MKTVEDFKDVADFRDIVVSLRNAYVDDFHEMVETATDEHAFCNWAVTKLREYNRLWNEIQVARPELGLKPDGYQVFMKHSLLKAVGEDAPESFKRALSYIKD